MKSPLKRPSRLQWESRCKSVACALSFALSAIGCGSAGEQESPRTSLDTARVAAPGETDTSHEAAPSARAIALRFALERLLRGDAEQTPEQTPEQTWFSSATARGLRSVTVDSAGHATVDFEDLRTLIPSASSSAGSAMLLEDLNSTVFGVNGVLSVDYLMELRCERFWEWLQYSCQTVHRLETRVG